MREPLANACTQHIRLRSLLLFPNTTLSFPSYNDAMATVRKAQSVEHNFQLVVTRVYEEGEEDILDDEEESAFHNLWRPGLSN